MIWEIDEASHRVEGLDEHGRARPEYAASLGLLPAPFGRRALAATLEAAVYVVLQLPMLIVALPGLLALTASGSRGATSGDVVLIVICAAASTVLTTAFVVTQLALHGRRGVTLGKAVTGLRSVNVRTLERPGFWRGAVVRALVLWASFAVPLVGPLLVVSFSPFFDGERRGRGWPDLAAATWFVDVRRGLNPYDAKRMRIARKTVATDLQDVRSELPSLATPVGEQAAAAAAYIPTTRSSGGVLGALRADGAAAPDGGADLPVSAAGVTATGGDGAAVSQAPVTSVPPWSPPASGAVAAPPAPAPAPAPAPQPASAPRPAPAPPVGSGAGWVPPRLIPDAEPPAPARQPQPAPAPAPAARGVSAALTLDDGEVIEIRGSGILLGRDPAPSPGDPRLVPVAIADPSMSVSKTHLAVIRAGAGLVAVDLGSTNGSAIVRAGVEHSLTARQQVALRDDDTIRLGDRHARLRIG